LEETLFSAQATLSDLISNASSNNTSNVNKIKSKLEKLISSNMGFERSLEGLETASNNLENLEREILQENLIDNNMIMNTNLTEIMELRGLISITRASIVAAISRAESRGSHQRTDIEETFNDTMLKHTLVDSNLQINWLPLRKSASGTWILTPSN
jgi:fumarate reductase flavoprotein subunit